MRTCRECGVAKPLDAFYEDARVKSDGRRSRCKDCMRKGGQPGPVPVDILKRYVEDENGCWLWTGFVTKRGYGSVKHNGKSIPAHRAVWLVLRGEIPEGAVLDHLCNVKRCVRPDHLEPVTHQTNMQRAWQRIVAHCTGCRCETKDIPMTDLPDVTQEAAPTWRRGRYQMHANELLDMLALPGELVAVVHDPLTGYLDLIVSDPDATPTLIGGYIEPKLHRRVRVTEGDVVVSDQCTWVGSA